MRISIIIIFIFFVITIIIIIFFIIISIIILAFFNLIAALVVALILGLTFPTLCLKMALLPTIAAKVFLLTYLSLDICNVFCR